MAEELLRGGVLKKVRSSDAENFILSKEALTFVADLHRQFNAQRKKLLDARKDRALRLIKGENPTFLKETVSIRGGAWKVAAAPNDLNDRRVEITGPVEAKMMINALNSGANVFMADFEDSCSPTWHNIIDGQQNCYRAVRRELKFDSPDGKSYRLKDKIATLVIRPRGWHLEEKNFMVDGERVSGSLFDFGLYFFHNAAELLKRGSGPYFYLPKMESHLEARLWNDVFTFAQKKLNIPHGSVRATVLIETILAAFETEEILYELRDHAAGLNAGRWDYIFSAIKKFATRKDVTFPDRVQVNMTVPFMRAYTERLVQSCHIHGAHAIGGMSAFIPSRKDAKVNEIALTKVREDKERESKDGFDGTWVAHPDLVPVAREIFDRHLGSQPNQKSRLREDVKTLPEQLIQFKIPNATVTKEGVQNNINVALQYLAYWLEGLGAVALHNLMEDAATAEISRAQLWQWCRHQPKLNDGTVFDFKRYDQIVEEEMKTLPALQHLKAARKLLDDLVKNDTFVEFLTLPAYEMI